MQGNSITQFSKNPFVFPALLHGKTILVVSESRVCYDFLASQTVHSVQGDNMH